MNVGNSLVMSPSLVTKYLDAAKDVAGHAVLLPDGIRFSPHTTRRDWTEELLAEIRGVYREFSDNGGGTSVNLQGIRFDTKDGGVLPLDKYLAATLELNGAPERLHTLAIERGLSPKIFFQPLGHAYRHQFIHSSRSDSRPLACGETRRRRGAGEGHFPVAARAVAV